MSPLVLLFKVFCSAAIFLLCEGPVWAADQGNAPRFDITAESAVIFATKRNKELSAARLVVQEAEALARGAGRLPNPELETEIAAGRDFEGRVAAGIMQRFPLTNRLRLERDISDLNVRMAGLEVGEKEWQLAVAVRKAFYELAAAREAFGISKRQAELAEALTLSLAEGVDAGFRSDLDLHEARLSAAKLREKAESLRGIEMESSAKLGEWLGLPSNTHFVLIEKLLLPSALPATRSADTRLDLQLAELALRSGETNVSLSKATRWDDVGVGLFVEGERFRDDPTGIQPEALAGLKLSIPLPIWQNGSGQVAAKEAAHKQLGARLDSLRFAMRNQILFAYRLMSLRFDSAARFGNEILPAANTHIRESEAAFARAEVDLQAIFRARDRLAEIELSDLEARKAYFIAHSEWLGALGESKTNP